MEYKSKIFTCGVNFRIDLNTAKQKYFGCK